MRRHPGEEVVQIWVPEGHVRLHPHAASALERLLPLHRADRILQEGEVVLSEAHVRALDGRERAGSALDLRRDGGIRSEPGGPRIAEPAGLPRPYPPSSTGPGPSQWARRGGWARARAG